MKEKAYCPSCGSFDINTFYEIKNVPAHSVLLLRTKEKALQYSKRDVKLGFCRQCGFIFNTVFDPSVHEYSPGYEATQSFSETFSAFHQKLAAELVERYGLRNKTIIEIGCGNGEFLTLLCDLGDNKGIGFDPAFREEQKQSSPGDKTTFIKDFYSEKYSAYKADFICCKMTLEHIHDTANFISKTRHSIGDNYKAKVFFQLPEARRILRELAFWDIYYEHCSYFSRGSLGSLFRKCGFDVIDLWTEYEDQYLMITAKPGTGGEAAVLSQENDMDALKKEIDYFAENSPARINEWKQNITHMKSKGKRIVIWPSGSKSVAFLTTLGIRDEIEYAVDINPRRQGSYTAGTGQKIVSPDFLKDYRPDVVIVMNPVYKEEIKNILNEMDLEPELITV
jgi:SAM-dependent methyltransferase